MSSSQDKTSPLEWDSILRIGLADGMDILDLKRDIFTHGMPNGKAVKQWLLSRAIGTYIALT